MTDEEKQRLLDNTLVGASLRFRAECRQLLRLMAREWRTFVAVASIMLAIMVFVIEHLHIS